MILDHTVNIIRVIMALNIEIFVPRDDGIFSVEKWVSSGETFSSGGIGIIKQNLPDGETKGYLIHCEDEESTIYESRVSYDDFQSQLDKGICASEMNKLVILEENQAYIMSIRADESEVRNVVRFRQE